MVIVTPAKNTYLIPIFFKSIPFFNSGEKIKKIIANIINWMIVSKKYAVGIERLFIAVLLKKNVRANINAENIEKRI